MDAATSGGTTVSDLMMRSLLDVFDERVWDRRVEAIAQVYSPDITFYEAAGSVAGPEGLARRVQDLLDQAPAWSFRPRGAVSVNHDLGRLAWGVRSGRRTGTGHRHRCRAHH
ncbi:MAG: hypothetical protein AVDCRST_MAG34-1778 [uncultured Nocardioidaceae bacterium]|uniref:SnoaL-like domain-containing protein n=1 Tax=uncultured Nocardioidaceae bacterium TaxID=253824 RepID=A0A6J4M693_9ACTN|nr:MAG: hypothetical protein AVDCRST_MAG34-1778 [uncultured Nocardioidaceae bacterium]